MITESINDKHNDFRIINNILSSASMIYWRQLSEGNIKGRKVYLTNLIKTHALWTETNRWKTWIYWVIEEKKKENITKKKKIIIEKFRKIKEESHEDDSSSGMFSKFISRITKPIATFELDHEQRMEIEAIEEEGLDRKTNLNIIFNILSSYLRFLSQYGIRLEVAQKIVLYFWERYELDKDRTHLLLSELESTYTKDGLSDKEKNQIEIQKLIKLNTQMGNEKMWIILYYVSEFLGSDRELIKILRMNKLVNHIMKPVVYRRWLNNTTFKKRSFLWNYFLDIDRIKWDYEALKDRINQRPDIIEKVEEVIYLDVQRSFNNTESISRENLSNILKTYAFYNPEIGYWQGMNFLAGFFYFYYKDEEKAFKAMLGLIQKFDLTELFNTNLPRLKLYFYMLDRLIAMYLPDLHEHFKNECVTSSLFSSAWFITWFCNTISHQRTSNITNNLLFFWDNFVVDGYLVVFQVSIILLELYEDKLLPLSFEEMLNYIVDIPKMLFTNNETMQGIFSFDSLKEDENMQRTDEHEEEIILFDHGSDVNEHHLSSINFPTLLKNSTITVELLKKLEEEYKENERRGSFI